MEPLLRIVHVVGARPNYMKIAPIVRVLAAEPRVEQFLVNTGQHYDHALSEILRDELALPAPYASLGVGSGTHAQQTADAMRNLDPVLEELRPDWVVVPGDVNSTLAAALVAVKRGLRVAHVEAGLRSRDRTMPEEINRIIVDSIANLLLTPSRDADDNLRAEGIDESAIRFVGNVMIDSLVAVLPAARARGERLRAELGLDGPFGLVTLHRPTNVDEPAAFAEIGAAVEELATEIDVVFPMHPRTRARGGASLLPSQRLRLLEPLGYLDFLALEADAAIVLTDSGGIQEETTYLGVPCLTLRRTTERPITITQGTNQLVALDASAIVEAARRALAAGPRPIDPPELWDGRAAERIVAALIAS